MKEKKLYPVFVLYSLIVDYGTNHEFWNPPFVASSFEDAKLQISRSVRSMCKTLDLDVVGRIGVGRVCDFDTNTGFIDFDINNAFSAQSLDDYFLSLGGKPRTVVPEESEVEEDGDL